MNNLKRVLSLALASVMLIGMMVVGASAADFTDADEIQHTEAVDILVALGVVNGKEDGSYFDPTGNVTRAEMAKMIAVAMKGGNDVETGTKGVPSFTDIAGHWAESYIEYCYDLGIISGRGDGTFDPNANVTGTEVTKMVLTALGYDSVAYGLTGASWATRTDELARKNADPQLYEDLAGVVLNVPASRDVAAQIIWNGLQNETMEYAPQTNKSNGEITWGYGGSGKTMLKERYDGDVYTGSFDGNHNVISSLDKGQIRVTKNTAYAAGSKQNTAAGSLTTASFPYDMDISFIGEEVKVIYKNGARSTQNGPDKNDTIYGVFVTGTTPVINTTMDKLAGVEDKKVLEVDKAEYDLAASGVTVIKNYVGTGTTYSEAASSLGTDGFKGNSNDSSAFTRVLFGNETSNYWATTTSATKNGNGGKAGFPVKIVLNDSNAIEKIYIVESQLAVVSTVTSSKVSLLPSVGTIDIADNEIYDDIKKNDVVVVTTLYKTSATADNAYTIVKKADVVTGKVTAYKNTETISVDGTAYKLNTRDAIKQLLSGDYADVTFTAPGNRTTTDPYGNFNTMLTKSTEVNLYFVDGYVAGVEKVKDTNNQYYVVTQISAASGTSDAFDSLRVEVMGADGTKTILKLHEDSSDDVFNRDIETAGNTTWGPANNDIEVGDLITYSMKSDGTANVTRVAAVSAGVWGYDEDTKSVTYSGASTYVTSGDCVVYVETSGVNVVTDTPGQTARNKGEFKAYAIRSLKDITGAVNGTVYLDDGKAVAVFLDSGAKASSTGSDALIGIVKTVSGSTRIDGTNYYQFVVSAGGENYTLNLTNTVQTAVKLGERSIVYFTPKADNIYDTASDVIKLSDTAAHAASAGYDSVFGGIVNAGDFTVYGYVKEYDKAGGIISVYTADQITKVGTNNYQVIGGQTATTYAIDKDAKIYYVDADAKTTAVDGSVTSWDSTTGYKNVILVLDTTGKKVQMIIAEQGNERSL